jgi:hypothetical protein
MYGVLLGVSAHSRFLHFAANEQRAWVGFASSLAGAFIWGEGAPQIPPLRSPEFLSRLVALANFMRSSLTKTAHVDLSDGAKQEFGYAPVGMTKGRGALWLVAAAGRVRTAGRSTELTGRRAGGMTKGRVAVALKCCLWAGRKAGPSASLRYGRDDKFILGAS